jgi:predicted Zn-dependent peptidase
MKFTRKVLANGMTILFEKRELPVISVAFAVRAGGVNETPQERGISHFIEHLLYKGTPTRDAKKIAEEIENNGGELNGFTSEEITAFWCKMPSQHLDVALEVLSDMVKNPLFDQTEFEKERKVILEEIKMYHDNPHMHSLDEIQKSLYDGVMGIGLAGTPETLNSMTRQQMIDKFKAIYTPNNMILCVVGDADFNKIVKFAEKNFGKEKNPVPQIVFGKKTESKSEKRKDVDQASLVFGYHLPLATDEKSSAAVILNSLLAGGMSSRLFSEIREKRNLAYAVKGDTSINRTFSYGIVYVGTMKENVDKVKTLIVEEFEKVSKELGEEELKITKEKLIGNYRISMEDSQEQMANLLGEEVIENAENFYKFEKEISEVKLEDVKELAKQAASEHSFFSLVPK